MENSENLIGILLVYMKYSEQAGGCCHSYIEKGYEFDVGIHYVGELNYQSVTKTFIDQITDNQLIWAPLG